MKALFNLRFCDCDSGLYLDDGVLLIIGTILWYFWVFLQLGEASVMENRDNLAALAKSPRPMSDNILGLCYYTFCLLNSPQNL